MAMRNNFSGKRMLGARLCVCDFAARELDCCGIAFWDAGLGSGLLGEPPPEHPESATQAAAIVTRDDPRIRT